MNAIANVSVTHLNAQYHKLMDKLMKQMFNRADREKLSEDVDELFRAGLLQMFPRGQRLSAAQVAAYNALTLNKDVERNQKTASEIAAMIQQGVAFSVPAWFTNLAKADAKGGTVLSRRFCDTFCLVLGVMGSSCMTITYHEGNAVQRCVSKLAYECQKYGVGQYSQMVSMDMFVTKMSAPAPGDKPAQTEEADSNAAADESAKGAANAAADESAKGAVNAAAANLSGKQQPSSELDALLAKLDSLTGLDGVKENVRTQINVMKMRKLREQTGLPTPPISMHLVFTGNPGTGKTTVARLLAEIYRCMGVLSKGQFVEVGRQDLVAGYIGQTATKTSEVIQKSLGGVLFIDEAYTLASEREDDFGHEAIDTLLKSMEDNRADFMVIVAGYTDRMSKFIHSNPGLESRFSTTIEFADYNGRDLYEIFEHFCRDTQYVIDEAAKPKLKNFFNAMYKNRGNNFGNARDVRNIYEKAYNRQANRIAAMPGRPSRDALVLFTIEDILGEQEC